MKTGSTAWCLAAALLSATLVSAILTSRGSLSGSYRIDEAHKLSETVFLRLLLEGRFADPAWFGHIVDRTNPPAGKYLLGLGLLAQGQTLPDRPSLSILSVDGTIPPMHPPEETLPYEPLLIPGRRAALAATALTAALLSWIALRFATPLAAVVTVVLFAFSFPVLGWGASAIFDPFLTLAILAPLPLLVSLADRAASARLARLVTAGALCGVAFQIRFSGGVALAAALACTVWLLAPGRRQMVTGCAALIAAAAVTAVAINPYYWAAAPAGEFASSPLLRVPRRLALQIADLGALSALVSGNAEVLETPLMKARYVAEIAFGDPLGVVGMVLAIAAIAAATRLLRRDRPTAVIFIWAVVVVIVYGGWLPFAWPRYILPMMPALTLLAGLGAAEVASLVRSKIEARRSAS
ncbi:MAG: hypothetical protein ABR517_13170 [Thermoanaerobaculia bacterium]